MRKGKWEEYEINILKNNYKKMTNAELSKLLDRTKTAIDIKINRLGLKKSKYTYNHNYFENIDTPEKAYWLGFIYADGYVVINEKINSCELAIQLKGEDFKHLKKFNKALDGNVEVDSFRKKCNLNNRIYDSCKIRFYSQKIVRDLIKLGIYPNKSLTLTFPNINVNLTPHFVRGFFDGDGCITKNNHINGKSYVRTDFTCGSEVFVKQLREILYKNNISSYIVKEKDKPFRLMIGGMKNCDNFLKYIYNDATVYLDRKFNKKHFLYESLNIEQRLPL